MCAPLHLGHLVRQETWTYLLMFMILFTIHACCEPCKANAAGGTPAIHEQEADFQKESTQWHGPPAQADLFSEVAILERLRPCPSVSRLLSYGVEADAAVRPIPPGYSALLTLRPCPSVSRLRIYGMEADTALGPRIVTAYRTSHPCQQGFIAGQVRLLNSVLQVVAAPKQCGDNSFSNLGTSESWSFLPAGAVLEHCLLIMTRWTRSDLCTSRLSPKAHFATTRQVLVMRKYPTSLAAWRGALPADPAPQLRLYLRVFAAVLSAMQACWPPPIL